MEQEAIDVDFAELEKKLVDSISRVAESHKVEYQPQLVKDISKTVQIFKKRPINISDRAKVVLKSLVLTNLQKLHPESLLNLPTLIKVLQLDVDQDGQNTGELMQAMLE